MLKISGAHFRRIALLDRDAFWSEFVDVLQNVAHALVLRVSVKDYRKVGVVEQFVFQHVLSILLPAHPVEGVHRWRILANACCVRASPGAFARFFLFFHDHYWLDLHSKIRW